MGRSPRYGFEDFIFLCVMRRRRFRLEPPPFPMRASLLNYSLHSFPKARKKAPQMYGEPFTLLQKLI